MITVLTIENVEEYDLIVITTAHTNVDYGMVQENAAAANKVRDLTLKLAEMECEG